MDNKKPQVGSSSSLTSQLFGSPESSSSNDVLASIFPPKGTGRNSNEPSGNQPWNTKQDDTYKHGDNATYGCLSSSLHYGGRESYAKPTTNQTSTSYPKFKKDGGEDDPSGASRGNWWQGSLYY